MGLGLLITLLVSGLLSSDWLRIMPVRRPGGGFVQCFDAMNVLHISLQKRAPRIQIILAEVLFRERFVEVIANPILYRSGH